MVRTDAPEVGLEAQLTSIADILSGAAPAEAQAPDEDGEETENETVEPIEQERSGCGGCAVEDREASWPLALIAGVLGLALFRRRR